MNKMGFKCACCGKPVDQTIQDLLNGYETYQNDLVKVHQVLTQVVPSYDSLTKALKKKVKYLEKLYFTGRNLEGATLRQPAQP